MTGAALLASAAGAAGEEMRQAGLEPPSSYAGICDVYGDGFFLVPGTEGCLKIGSLAYSELQAMAPSSRVNGGPSEGDRTPRGGSIANASQVATAGQRDALGYVMPGRVEAPTASDDPRGSNATVPLLAYTATFGKGFSAMLPFEGDDGRSTGVGSAVANDQGTAGTGRVPEIAGDIRLDQPWGAMQLSGAMRQARGDAAANNDPGAGTNSASQFGMAVQGGLNTDVIAPGDKLWLQAAFEQGAHGNVEGDNLAWAYGKTGGSHDFGARISPQDYNFGWNAQLPSDCVYTGLTAATATCDKPWGFSFTGAFKHFWTPDLSSSVFGSSLSTKYDPQALAGLGGAAGVSDTRETRIGGSVVWTPVKGLDIGTDFMYLHLSQSTPADAAPNYRGTSLNAAGVPTFKNDSNEYEGRIRVQRGF